MKYYLAHSDSGQSHWQFDASEPITDVIERIEDALGETVYEIRGITRSEFEKYEI